MRVVVVEVEFQLQHLLTLDLVVRAAELMEALPELLVRHKQTRAVAEVELEVQIITTEVQAALEL